MNRFGLLFYYTKKSTLCEDACDSLWIGFRPDFLSSPTVEFIHHISDPFTIEGIAITPFNLIIT